MWERYIWLMPALVAASWPLRHRRTEWEASSRRRRGASLEPRLGDVGG
jgi:hypothetical protein